MITQEQKQALVDLSSRHPGHTHRKFCQDTDKWMRQAQRLAVFLKLDTGPALDILDIGAGLGYFAFVTGRMGHRVVACERNNPFVLEAMTTLGIAPTVAEIVTNTPMDIPGKYNLVTAIGVNFKDDNHTYWGPSEYAFLTRDIMEHKLLAGGAFVLKPNLTNGVLEIDVDVWADLVSDVASVSVETEIGSTPVIRFEPIN